MTYPEKGTSYRHTPKFIDRMKEGEIRDRSATPWTQLAGPDNQMTPNVPSRQLLQRDDEQ